MFSFTDFMSCSKDTSFKTYKITYCGHLICESCVRSASNCPVCNHLYDVQKNVVINDNGTKIYEKMLSVINAVKMITTNIACKVQEMDETNETTISNMSTESLAHLSNPSIMPKHTKSSDTANESKRSSEQSMVDVPSSTSQGAVEIRAVTKTLKRTQMAECPADPNKRNALGETPLHRASSVGDEIAVSRLLVAGVNVNARDHAGWTALHEAAQAGHSIIVELLLKAGALADAPGFRYHTPLHMAVVRGHVPTVQILLEYGADFQLRTAEGTTALDMANDNLQSMILQSDLPTKASKANQRLVTYDPVASATVFIIHSMPEQLDSMKVALANVPKLQLAHTFGKKVTHVVVCAQQLSNDDLTLLLAIVNNLFIVTIAWLEECAQQATIVDTDSYFIDGPYGKNSTTDLMCKICDSRLKMMPKLFDGCFIYLAGFDKLIKTKYNLKKSDIMKLIEEGGGTMLKREPHPRNISEINMFPWFAPKGAKNEQCNNYIIYNRTPTLRYNMKEILHVPIEWLLQSIWEYRLVPLAELILPI